MIYLSFSKNKKRFVNLISMQRIASLQTLKYRKKITLEQFSMFDQTLKNKIRSAHRKRVCKRTFVHCGSLMNFTKFQEFIFYIDRKKYKRVP